MTKSMLLAAALLVSGSAFACPELTGDWTCTDKQGSVSKVKMTQEAIENGVMYYSTDEKGETNSFPADGKTYNDDGADYSTTFTAACTSSARVDAKMGVVAKSYDMMIDANIVIELTDPNTMVTTVTGFSADKKGGNKQAIDEATTCKK